MIKKIKQKIHEAIERKYKDEFNVKEAQLKLSIDTKLYELEREKKRLDDEIADTKHLQVKQIKANNELKEQIRVLEAKASPDNVWANAFGHGFVKAYEQMQELSKKMNDNMEKYLTDKIYSEAMDNLGQVAEERINILDRKDLKDKLRIQEKRDDIQRKLDYALEIKNEPVAEKYTHYREVLDWVLSNGEKHDTRSA